MKRLLAALLLCAGIASSQVVPLNTNNPIGAYAIDRFTINANFSYLSSLVAGGGSTLCSNAPGAGVNGDALTATSTANPPTCAWQTVSTSVTEASIANSEYVAASGTNTLTGSTTTSYASLASGFMVRVLIANTNTGAVTFQVNSIAGTPAVTKNGTTALTGGELIAGHLYLFQWDGTEWQIIGLSYNPAASLITITTGTSATLSTAYTINQEATAGQAVTYTLPTASAATAVTGQYCVDNGNGGAANTGALTVATSASGQFIIFTDGTLSATGGNVVSGGAARDGACFVGVDSTHWMFYPHSVSGVPWTKN